MVPGSWVCFCGFLRALQLGIATYTYNAENQLTSTAGVTYTYDGDGKRVMKSSGTLYWYGTNSGPLMETALNGTANYVYYFFNGQIINRREFQHGGNVVDTYVLDHLGSTSIVSGYSGAWDQSTYYPFGGERAYAGNVGNHYKFTGKERDPESGLDDFDFRFFGSSIGRFISPDDEGAEDHPGDPQGLNLYGYVQDNPTNATDPDGHDCVWVSGNSAYVKRGDCSGISNGRYVAGTVDEHSGRYNSDTHTLSFDYTPDAGPGIARGVIGNVVPTHPYPTEFDKFVSRVAVGNDNINAIVTQLGIQAVGGVAGRTIGTGVEAAVEARAAQGALKVAQQALKSLPPEQYQLVQKWVGNIHPGSPVMPPPPGLTTEAMEAYLNVAKAYVERGSTVGGMATQIARIRVLQAALGHQ